MTNNPNTALLEVSIDVNSNIIVVKTKMIFWYFSRALKLNNNKDNEMV